MQVIMWFHPSEIDSEIKKTWKICRLFLPCSPNFIQYKKLYIFWKQLFKSQIFNYNNKFFRALFLLLLTSTLMSVDIERPGTDSALWCVLNHFALSWFHLWLRWLKIKCLWIWVLLWHDSRMQVEDFKGATTPVLLIFLRQWLNKLLFWLKIRQTLYFLE